MDYYEKYLKYKEKYLSLKKEDQTGGAKPDYFGNNTSSVYITADVMVPGLVYEWILRRKALLLPQSFSGDAIHTDESSAGRPILSKMPHLTLFNFIYNNQLLDDGFASRNFVTILSNAYNAEFNNIVANSITGGYKIYGEKTQQSGENRFLSKLYQINDPGKLRDFRNGLIGILNQMGLVYSRNITYNNRTYALFKKGNADALIIPEYYYNNQSPEYYELHLSIVDFGEIQYHSYPYSNNPSQPSLYQQLGRLPNNDATLQFLVPKLNRFLTTSGQLDRLPMGNMRLRVGVDDLNLYLSK